MKNAVLISLLFFASVSTAAEAPPAPEPSVAPAPQSDWPRRRLKLRAGSVTENPDASIANSWEHKPEKSYQASIGLLYNMPRAWEKVRFILGGEFKYLTSRAELQGAGSASVESQFYQLMFDFGVELRPIWAKPFGFNFVLAHEVWGEKHSQLKAAGFSQSLGRQKTYDETVAVFLLPQALEIGFFWEVSKHWKPALTIDSRRKGNAITLGVDYVF